MRIPLHRHLALRTGIRAVIARFARLIWTHGPTSILGIRSDGDQTCIGGELTLSSALLYCCGFVSLLVQPLMKTSMTMAMTKLGSLNSCDEGAESHSTGRNRIELHGITALV